MGKGSRIRQQKKLLSCKPPTNTTLDPILLKADAISQSIVGLSKAYYSPSGRLTIDVSRETRRAQLDKLTTELAKVNIKAQYAYPNIQRDNFTVAAEPVAEDYLDDINASVPTVQVDVDSDKIIDLKSKYEYSVKFDDYSMIMKLPYDDVILHVSGPHNYKSRIILNKNEVNRSVKDMNRRHKTWGPNIVGYAILYDNDMNPDEWVIGVPLHMHQTYKKDNKTDSCYQLTICMADGLFAVSNEYEKRKQFRYNMMEYSTTLYTYNLLTSMISVWNTLIRAISDPEMKKQWVIEEFTNENGGILTKYTQLGPEKSPSGILIMNPTTHQSFINKIDNSCAQSEIITTREKLSEIVMRYSGSYDLLENDPDVYLKSPYDDFVVMLDDKWFYRVILDKEKIKAVTKSYMEYRQFSETVGLIMINSHEHSEYMIMGVLTFEKFLGRSDVFKLTLNPKMGISIYEHDESKLNEFHKIVQTGFGINDSTEILMFITVLPTIIKALNDPEIREIWTTKTVSASDGIISKYYPSNNKPIENIKRIYMCEHQETGRQLERHTDKWFVRGHEVHRKDGKVYFRKGHYKGPAREDTNVKLEPRKRSIDTFGNNLNKEDLDEFYKLLK